ncbi:uncharacterized protein PITG_13067 [Phytophthora infestans T30-4]|uniref:Uncharacterized protein n=1 Tax=Phytophthora infestans (strain T30-4) TaxID=403677 RepID=D0NK80_PHYIT|nr:uncharacterized protein PITG_13067 [Phytophthora infestans T30-4]EEY59917.1 conserved hypothetical protein [Phytophthora infestans T30-4]|eukprot:XP_002900602.1 conserved hypothetical protein [Phytophthora infestans T30-4]
MDHALSGVHSAELFMRNLLKIYEAQVGVEGVWILRELRPENLSKLLQIEHMGGQGEEGIPKGHGDQGLDGDFVWGLPDRRISEIARQVKPAEAGNGEDQDWLDATGVPFISDRKGNTERREVVRLDHGSEPFFRVFEHCMNAMVERRRVAWDAAVLKILRTRHAVHQNRAAVTRLARVERERANGRKRTARSYANYQLGKGQKRGEIMELTGMSKRFYQKAVKRLKLKVQRRSHLRSRRLLRVLQSQLYNSLRFTRKAPRCYISNHSVLRHPNSSTSLQARINISLQHSSTFPTLQSCSTLPTVAPHHNNHAPRSN